MEPIPKETLQAIERHFHALIRERAGELIDRHNVVLPTLAVVGSSEKESVWFRVPGMYGGFSYWLEGDGAETKLIAESWSRVVGGSGQRHEITDQGYRLVDEGFV